MECNKNEQYKCVRNLDGAYFRVEIPNADGTKHYENRCFSDLTPKQMADILQDKPINYLRDLCILLGKTIYDIGESMDCVGTVCNHLNTSSDDNID